MKKEKKTRTADGFTKSEKEIAYAIKGLIWDFDCQNHYSDPVKFIADKLDERGFIDNIKAASIGKYTIVNKYLVQTNQAAFLRDSYEKCHQVPNPEYNYDYGGSSDAYYYVS